MSDGPKLVSIQRVKLGPHHHPSLTTHTRSDLQGVRPFPPFVELEIASYPQEQGCYLFHICADGQGADTWHQSVGEAVDQAEWEFGVRPDEWIVSPKE